VTNFNPPHLHLSPLYGVIPFEFRHDLWHQKTRVMGLLCGVFAWSYVKPFWYNTGVWQTDTHRHTTKAYTALSIPVAR